MNNPSILEQAFEAFPEANFNDFLAVVYSCLCGIQTLIDVSHVCTAGEGEKKQQQQQQLKEHKLNLYIK